MRRLPAIALLLAAACAAGPLRPDALDTRNDVCASCRMPVSDASLAAQLVARGEETRFFDDIGCARDFLSFHPRPAVSALFVADHRTRAWVPAEKAVYTRARIETPMGSRLIAHADAASRDSDPAAAGGETVPAALALGEKGPFGVSVGGGA